MPKDHTLQIVWGKQPGVGEAEKGSKGENPLNPQNHVMENNNNKHAIKKEQIQLKNHNNQTGGKNVLQKRLVKKALE